LACGSAPRQAKTVNTAAGVAVLGFDGQDGHRGQQEADVHQRMRPERGEDAQFFL
jgi:hypothetical protein